MDDGTKKKEGRLEKIRKNEWEKTTQKRQVKILIRQGRYKQKCQIDTFANKENRKLSIFFFFSVLYLWDGLGNMQTKIKKNRKKAKKEAGMKKRMSKVRKG